MASVRIDFSPPVEEEITKLHIFEAPTKDGVYSEIEEVTAVGTYPNYISYYTTNQAISAAGWFAIQWEDSKGAKSDLSAPIQGGTTSIVAAIVAQIKARDSSIDESVATLEAASVAEQYFNRNPYEIPVESVTYWQISGLTMMALARSSLVKLAQSSAAGTADKWTAGLVTVQSGTGSQTLQQARGNVEALLDEAANVLGLNRGVVAQMVIPEIAGGAAWYGVDISRLLVEVDA